MKAIIRIAVAAVYNTVVLASLIISIKAISGALVMQQEMWGFATICVILAGASYHILTKEGKQ